MSNIQDLTADNFQQILGEVSQTKLVALMFWSPQSPECQVFNQTIEKVVADYPEHLVLAKLNCDAEQALASQLAQQIGLQAIPTTVLLKNAGPVDMLSGPQTEFELKEALSKHLPNPTDILLENAKQALLSEDHNQAFIYAKQAYEMDSNSTKVKLVFADICVNIKKLDEASALLEAIEENERDPYYLNILSKLAHAKEQLDSPELKLAQLNVDTDPDNLSLKIELASLLANAGRKEEALNVLLIVLKRDMNFGDAKKDYLAIIDSLPQGDAIAVSFRRKLYSLLY